MVEKIDNALVEEWKGPPWELYVLKSESIKLFNMRKKKIENPNCPCNTRRAEETARSIMVMTRSVVAGWWEGEDVEKNGMISVRIKRRTNSIDLSETKRRAGVGCVLTNDD